ncbi:MAG: DRTGG domain-containing protein [Sphaerochaetaceae bacterium]|jgi:predicted transcriptional regulator|nr:DRTGG domain-containing protein [Sphaerochaetaceae bacterium]
MKINQIVEAVKGKVACCQENLDKEVRFGFASDLMSDVLTLRDDDILLITGLSNIQAIRTAELSDISVVLLVRNKTASKEMVDMAREAGIVLITTEYSMFRTSGILYEKGLPPIY